MSLLMEATIEVSAILSLALLTTALLRRRSAAVRHWILAAAILCGAVAPMLKPIAPAWNLPIAVSSEPERPLATQLPGGSTSVASGAAAQVSSDVPSDPTPPTINRLLLLAWTTGAAISLLLLIAGLIRLSWLSAHADRLVTGPWLRLTRELSHSIGLSRPVALLQSDHSSLPVTWGFARPKIVLPTTADEWSDERLRVVLLHELAHIKRGDWLTLLAVEGLRAVYWFNPLLWIISRRLRQECEQACDDAVLGGGVDSVEYASHLLALARSTVTRRAFFSRFPAPAMARPSSLQRRFRAMLNDRLNRRPISRSTRLVTTILVLMVTVLIAGFGAQTFSSFSGSVVDSTNRIVPGVTLVLTNLQSQAKYEIKSDGDGRFQFVGLPPGEYAWQAGLPGFATMRGNLTVSGQDIQRDLTLRVGVLQETITIKGVRPPNAPPRAASDASAVRPAQQPKPCAAGPVGGTIKAPTKVRSVDPRYPAELNAAKIGGVVILEAVIDPTGNVSDVSVLRSPHPGLEVAAVDAVRQWRYTATLLNCVPVDVRINVTAAFVP